MNPAFKASAFNVRTEALDGNLLLFNGKTLSLLVIPPPEWPRYRALLNESPAIRASGAEPYRKLLEGGFIVDASADEVAAAAAAEQAEATDPSKLLLYLFPTTECNLACPYCFIRRTKERFSDETVARVRELVRRRTPALRRLTLVWYGGEPLIEAGRIEEVGGAVLRDHPAVRYEGVVYTNGVLLTPEVSRRLRAAGVTKVHLALDGDAGIHDRRRRTVEGQPTLERILANLAAVEGVFERIGVRIHVDKDNVRSVRPLLGLLKERGLHARRDVTVYFAPIEAETPTCHYLSDTCFSTRDYAAVEVALTLEAMEHGFEGLEYPQVTPTHCLARVENQVAVGPDGHLYKCLAHTNYRDRAVGNLHRPATADERRVGETFRCDAFTNKEGCPRCAVLHQCMGGCAYKGFEHSGGRRGFHIPLKYNIKQRLQLQYAIRRPPEPPSAGGAWFLVEGTGRA